MIGGQKHHYLPIFYLKQWCGADGRLCEFSRPHKEVKPKMVHPSGTGYERGLYAFDGLPAAAANFLERRFLLRADDRAHLALQRLLVDQVDFDLETQSAWSRFIMTLLHRNPEAIAHIKQRASEHVESLVTSATSGIHASDEVRPIISDAHIQEVTLRALRSVMDSERVGKFLNRMVWGVIAIHRPKFFILTSDRPLVMTNGLAYPGSFLLLPISPTRTFVAAATRKTIEELANIANHPKFVTVINDRVASQARKYVYSTNDSQLRFVANRLGKELPSTPLETISGLPRT